MKKFLLNVKGVAAVEFSLTIGLYFMVMFMIFELTRIAIVTAYWDLAIVESIRSARHQQIEGNDYSKAFLNELNQQKSIQNNSTMGMFMLLDNGRYNVETEYVDCTKGEKGDCIDALLKGAFITGTKDSEGNIKLPAGLTLARYNLNYDYSFAINMPFLPTSWVNQLLNRKIIIMQEAQRPN